MHQSMSCDTKLAALLALLIHCISTGTQDSGWLKGIGSQDIVLEDDIGQGVSYTSAMCLLRGRVYEALENRARAIRWYKAALHVDPFCYEAFRVSLNFQMILRNSPALVNNNRRPVSKDIVMRQPLWCARHWLRGTC